MNGYGLSGELTKLLKMQMNKTFAYMTKNDTEQITVLKCGLWRLKDMLNMLRIIWLITLSIKHNPQITKGTINQNDQLFPFVPEAGLEPAQP